MAAKRALASTTSFSVAKCSQHFAPLPWFLRVGFQTPQNKKHCLEKSHIRARLKPTRDCRVKKETPRRLCIDLPGPIITRTFAALHSTLSFARVRYGLHESTCAPYLRPPSRRCFFLSSLSQSALRTTKFKRPWALPLRFAPPTSKS